MTDKARLVAGRIAWLDQECVCCCSEASICMGLDLRESTECRMRRRGMVRYASEVLVAINEAIADIDGLPDQRDVRPPCQQC